MVLTEDRELERVIEGLEGFASDAFSWMVLSLLTGVQRWDRQAFYTVRRCGLQLQLHIDLIIFRILDHARPGLECQRWPRTLSRQL